MKSENEIYLDYQRAQDVVGELRGMARDTRTIQEQDFHTALGAVRASWSGDNADEFLRRASKLDGEIGGLADSLERIAQAIEEMSQNLYDAETAAQHKVQEAGGGAVGGGAGGGGGGVW